ncbi:MAG: LPD25 domain-containing protein [Lachnospiraceae bacterium]
MEEKEGNDTDEKKNPYGGIDVLEIAERINRLQKKMDPDGYASFYPEEEKHKSKIAMQLLVDQGKEDICKWLSFGQTLKSQELSQETLQLLQILKEGEMKMPYNMEPFVYIDFCESPKLEAGEILALKEAVLLFGELDYEQYARRKNRPDLGCNKTYFCIMYLREGKLCSYHGRQDLGMGEGNLFCHIEAHQNYYLKRIEGREYLRLLPQNEASEIADNCKYVREELLPTLQYFCNLAEIEKALIEEWKLNKTMCLEPEHHEARCQYQKDVFSFIRKSREALNYGGELPKMPDIRQYQEKYEMKNQNREAIEMTL